MADPIRQTRNRQTLYGSYLTMGAKDFFINSWRTYGGAWRTFLLLGVIYTVVSGGLHLGKPAVLALVIEIMRWAVLTFTTMAITMVAHKASDGEEEMGVGESYTLVLGLVGKYVGTLFLYFVIVFFGLLLFIIPGLIWTVRYYLAPYAVIVEGIGARDALVRSAALTKGRKLRIFALEVGFGLLFLVLVTAPASALTALAGGLLGRPEWAVAITLFSTIISEELFVIFNVLLLKSLRESA